MDMRTAVVLMMLFLEFGPIINLSTASLHHGFKHASSPRGGTNERCPQSLPGRPPHKYTSSKGTNSKEDYTYQFIRACPHILGVEYRFICGAGLKSGLRSRILAFLTVWGAARESVRIGPRSSRNCWEGRRELM